jgi:Ankyrin repeats (3 copies)/Ankyrin repeat
MSECRRHQDDPSDDLFIQGPVDMRIILLLTTEVWQLLLSYLPVRDLISSVPLTNKYLCDEVVWGKWSGPLLWGEMAREGIDAPDYKWKPWIITASQTALQRAVSDFAPLKHVSTMIRGGMNVNHEDDNNITALYLACSNGDVEIVRVLLDAKANIQGSRRWNPLHVACLDGRLSCVKLLLQYGASLNDWNFDGYTPLMIAALSHRYDIVHLLMMHGANIHAKSKNGQSVMMILPDSILKCMYHLF